MEVLILAKTFVKRFEITESWQQTSKDGAKWLKNNNMTPWGMTHTAKYVEFRGTYNSVPATSKQGLMEWT